jgi:hypothetical protein
MRDNNVALKIKALSPQQIALWLAKKTTYRALKGIQGESNKVGIRDNSGARFVHEKMWKGVDFRLLLKHMQLSENKVLVLMLLKRGDWMQILALMDKKKLVRGLRFFPKEKLMRLMTMLPKRLIIKMLLRLMPLKDLIKQMPTREMMHIFRSKRLPVKVLVKALKNLKDRRFLTQLLGKISGRDVKRMTDEEMIKMLGGFKKHRLLDGMRFLPFKALQPLMTGLMKSDPEILMRMTGSFIFKQFDRMSKTDMLPAFTLVENDLLMKMLAYLPDQFLIQVVADVEDKVFEDYLMSEQTQLLSWLGNEMAA